MTPYTNKQIAIFHAALNLIQEYGFHGTPVSAVAEKANVATGTIYHYFKGKDQLLQELFLYCRQQLMEVTVAAAATKCDYKEKFESIWNGHFNFYIKNPEILIFFEQYSNSPFSENKQNQSLKSGPLLEFISKGIEKGLLKDLAVDIILIQILSNCVTYAKLHLFSKQKLSETKIQDIIAMTWDAISLSHKPEPQ